MAQIKTSLIEAIERTPTVRSFRFAASPGINFIPGQFLQVIFDPASPANKDLNKYLSFSSSPIRKYIEVTKRISASVFSQRLTSLKIGDEVCLKGPLGGCVFKEEYAKIGFLIGGIGITPVISILEYITEKRLDTEAVLFYSNRTEEEIAFKRELDYLQGANEKIKVFYILTDCRPKNPRCIFGRIDKNLVAGHVQDFTQRVFFIFGPPRMTEAMNSLCLELGCAKENIKTESFIGYS